MPGFSAWWERQKIRFARWLFRRKPKVDMVSTPGEVVVSAEPARVVISGQKIPRQAPVEEQVGLLIDCVENIERQACKDRERTDAEVMRIRKDVEVASTRSEQRVVDLAAQVRSLVLGSVRLQLLGLFLITLGTVVLAVSAFTS